jgi:hypothetical protein
MPPRLCLLLFLEERSKPESLSSKQPPKAVADRRSLMSLSGVEHEAAKRSTATSISAKRAPLALAAPPI